MLPPTKCVVQFTVEGRNVVVIDHSQHEARQRVLFYDPNGGWENAKAAIIAEVGTMKTSRILAIERSTSKIEQIQTAIQTLTDKLRNFGYQYQNETVKIKSHLKTLKEIEQIIKEKRILELKRKIATLNGHEGFAFDAPKISTEDYVDEKIRYSDLTVLVYTNRGIYRLVGSDEYVRIKVKSVVALQEVKVYEYRIFKHKQCIYYHMLIPTRHLVPGDTLFINFNTIITNN